MEEKKLHILIQKYLNGTADARERASVEHWYRSVNQAFIEVPVTSETEIKEIESKLLQALHARIRITNKETQVVPAHRVHFLKTSWFRYAAAIILPLGIITAIVVSSDRQSNKSGTDLSKKATLSDITPGGNKAVLTLADGSKIILDDAHNGSLAQQGNAQVVKLTNGQIAYNLKGLSQGEILMNTMSTPRGGQYQLTLPDGTKVWLNAASSITYPAAFVGKERNVEVTGEVYMEVAKNLNYPFSVTLKQAQGNSTKIEVLGTSFNINAYGDESAIKTTLISGSVKVINGKTVVLKPGQQAVAGLENLKVQAADIEQTLAWKNGIFQFEDADLKSVMRQLGRWYDMDIIYEADVKFDEQFNGELQRSLNLKEVLFILEQNQVHFRVEGRKLIVMP